MNRNQRDTLATCLTQIFGRVEDAFVDAAIPLLEWIELSGGETLMKEGDPADGVYFVISGRLRAYVESEEGTRPIGEIARGETVGEMGVLTREPRSASVVAIRDTVLAHATLDSFNELWRRHPQLPIHMARIVIERLKRSSERPRVRKPSTVCLLGITKDVDLHAFADDLVRELDRWGVATVETRARIDARFGAGAAETTQRDSDTYHRVATWLDDVEFWNEFVLLVADDGDTEWTRRCLRHADEVLLVGRAAEPSEILPIERALCMSDSAVTGARQTLVLLHDPETKHPVESERWLDRRPVDAHFHLREKDSRDTARLARIISGNAIGLVLSGGGARGFAHLGVYKALEEAGVAIDYVGGTSIGGVMAAYISFDLNAQKLIDCARRAFARNPTGDLNFIPFVSLIQGRRLKNTIAGAVVDAVGRDADVVDSWRTLYCVAANYSSAREMVITRGAVDRAVRASVSIPVALPPVVWEGELLVDGGVFNNFPTDVMAAMGARRIIGVDLARRSSRRYDFDEVPSGWQLLADRFRSRRRRRYKVPTLGALLMGTTILYSESRRERSRQSTDIYFNPDLARVGLLDWKAFDRIVDIGYQHAKEVLAAMPEHELAAYRNVTPAQEQEMAQQEMTA